LLLFLGGFLLLITWCCIIVSWCFVVVCYYLEASHCCLKAHPCYLLLLLDIVAPSTLLLLVIFAILQYFVGFCFFAFHHSLLLFLSMSLIIFATPWHLTTPFCSLSVPCYFSLKLLLFITKQSHIDMQHMKAFVNVFWLFVFGFIPLQFGFLAPCFVWLSKELKVFYFFNLSFVKFFSSSSFFFFSLFVFCLCLFWFCIFFFFSFFVAYVLYVDHFFVAYCVQGLTFLHCVNFFIHVIFCTMNHFCMKKRREKWIILVKYRIYFYFSTMLSNFLVENDVIHWKWELWKWIYYTFSCTCNQNNHIIVV
jgi:hypothetical protein